MKINEYSIAALSFLGDAVYELEIRNHLVELGIKDGDRLHRECTKYVRAEAQAKVVKALLKEAEAADAGCAEAGGAENSDGEKVTGHSFVLAAEEVALVKRARNHKFANRSRSADPVEYRLATGLEALMGRLYLMGDQGRIEELAKRAMEIIGESNRR